MSRELYMRLAKAVVNAGSLKVWFMEAAHTLALAVLEYDSELDQVCEITEAWQEHAARLEADLNALQRSRIVAPPEGLYGIWCEPIDHVGRGHGKWYGKRPMSYDAAITEADRMCRNNRAWHYYAKPVPKPR